MLFFYILRFFGAIVLDSPYDDDYEGSWKHTNERTREWGRVKKILKDYVIILLPCESVYVEQQQQQQQKGSNLLILLPRFEEIEER
jgi:hypothetical protein